MISMGARRLPVQARDRATNQIVANIMKYGATLEGVLADSVVDSDEKDFLSYQPGYRPLLHGLFTVLE